MLGECPGCVSAIFSGFMEFISLRKVILTCWIKRTSWGILDFTGPLPQGPRPLPQGPRHLPKVPGCSPKVPGTSVDGEPTWVSTPSRPARKANSRGIPHLGHPSELPSSTWVWGWQILNSELGTVMSFKAWNNDFFFNLEIKYSQYGFCSPDSYWPYTHGCCSRLMLSWVPLSEVPLSGVSRPREDCIVLFCGVFQIVCCLTH